MACKWESIKGDAHAIVEIVKSIAHEGNVRRVVVEHNEPRAAARLGWPVDGKASPRARLALE